MEELVKYMILALAENKDDVLIVMNENQIDVTVHKDDIGRIIGKQGRIVKAMRTIVKAAGGKEGKKYFLKVNETGEEAST